MMEHLGIESDRNCVCKVVRVVEFGQKKTNKHKHFRRDGLRDKQEPSLGQTGPLPGTNWDPSLGQTGLSLLNSTVKSPFCPVCPWDGWGFGPGTIVPQGPSEKCLCVFCLLGFFVPKEWLWLHGRGPPDRGWTLQRAVRPRSTFGGSRNCSAASPIFLTKNHTA